MDEKLKDQDVLLVREKGSDEVKVANTDKDGKVKTAKPNEENPDFLKIDKNANVLENFFENFKRQVQDPTRFEFFRVPAEKFQEVVKELQEAFKNPDDPKNKEFIDLHRVDPEEFLKKHGQKQEEKQEPEKTQGQTLEQPEEGGKKQSEYAINPDLVNWEQLKNFGITRETLEKTDNLEKMLNYQKTNLLPVSLKFDEVSLRTDARISLREMPDGSFSPAIHAIRKEPELERPYFGVRFTDEDKQNLLKTGNLGRIAEAEYKPGEKTPVFISIDKQTNELVASRTDRVKLSETIKGVQLNEQQKKELSEGKAVYLENMTSKKNTSFSAFVQFNADKRGFEFRFDNDKKQEQSKKQDNKQDDVPKTFRKKELTEDQQSSLKEGKTVYVDGLEDKKGKKYSGYITLNKDTGKTDFMFPKDYKKALEEGKVTPDDRHKTQVAVNSEGKTNESTKKVDKSLDKGQTQPTEKQAEKQEKQEKLEKPKKKGLKV